LNAILFSEQATVQQYMFMPISESSMTKRIALYARISTDGQTVNNQLQKIENVVERNGWRIMAR
jgi:hypothetical protein